MEIRICDIMKFENILVPIDGSVHSDNTVDLAIYSAHDFDSTLTFVYVVDVTESNRFGDVNGFGTMAKLEVEGTIALDVAESKAREEGVRFKTKLFEGVPGEVICELSKDYDQIIIGATGKSGLGKGRIGRTTDYIIEHSHCPVLCIKETSKKLERILLPIVDTHLPAIDDAIETAKKVNASVTVFAVNGHDKNFADLVEEVADRFREAGIKVETESAEGNPADCIIERADSYDQIIMGVGSRNAIDKILRGGTAERVVANASCPVTIIRNS